MSMFEIQITSDDRWKATGVFEDFEAAYESAERIERMRGPDRLRILRIDVTSQGVPREKTVHEGGVEVRGRLAAERKHVDQEAFRQRIEDRRVQRTAAQNPTRQPKQLFSSNSPVYLTLVSLSIGLTGLSAMYLVEKAFTS